MCLSIAMQRPNDVLKTGYHEGFKYHVIHNTRGYLCGYVQVPLGHPWHGKGDSWDEDSYLNALVHGGITFAEADTPCDPSGCKVEGQDDDWWVGFDCAHCSDSPDPRWVTSPTYHVSRWEENGKVWTIDEVAKQCESLCEQAKEACN